MRRHPIFVATLLIVLTCNTSPASDLPFPVAVAETVVVAREQILDGVLEAVNQSTVSAQTAGRVQEILVDVNDFVPAGTLIIRLRDTEQRAALAQAQAALEEARARFDEAQAEYQRIKSVFERNLVAKAQMDAASAALGAGRARLDAAAAGLDRAREQLEYTVIKAPYSGIVLERHIQLGESVQPGQPLISGFSLDRLRAVVNIPQRLIGPARQYARARIILPDDKTAVDASRLTFFPYADPQSNVFKVRVYLPEKSADLYPGMFVKVAFVLGELERLVIPLPAVMRRSEVTGAYVVAGDQISLRQLRVGREIDPGRVEVLAGLAAGEQVALDPVAAGIYLKQRQATAGP